MRKKEFYTHWNKHIYGVQRCKRISTKKRDSGFQKILNDFVNTLDFDWPGYILMSLAC